MAQAPLSSAPVINIDPVTKHDDCQDLTPTETLPFVDDTADFKNKETKSEDIQESTDSKDTLATPPVSLPIDLSMSDSSAQSSQRDIEEITSSENTKPSSGSGDGDVIEIDAEGSDYLSSKKGQSVIDISDDSRSADFEFVEAAVSKEENKENITLLRKRKSRAKVSPPSKPMDKEQQNFEKQQKKEMEKLEKEKQKIQREKERLEKKLKQEQDKEAKRKKLEEEKLLKKKKLEEEKIAKRKKLEEEKEAKRKKLEEEKEAKRRKLEEERELKRQKQEEEKELKRKKQQEEKVKKQLEKEAKEKERQEKLKAKEKAQSRISNFFTVQKKVSLFESKKSDYDSTFLDFYLKPNATMAPLGKLEPSKLSDAKALFDSEVLAKDNESFAKGHHAQCSVIAWLSDGRELYKRGFDPSVTAEHIVNSINNDSLDENEVMELLAQIPLKFIQFYENIKPAYCGTFSKKREVPIQNPFYKVQEIDYDYDSDFEEEEEEGDDIDDIDDDDDEDDEGEDNSDLEGFLDETDDRVNSNNKRPILARLVPVIQVNNINSNSSDEPSESSPVFANMAVDILQPNIEFPIDPFKNYWQKPTSPKKEAVSSTSPAKEAVKKASSSPSKATDDTSKPVATHNLTARKKPKTIITNQDELKSFIRLVHENNAFTLSTLVEILKKKFPSYTKVTVKNTLEHVASKIGAKASEKKWVINEQYKSQLVQA